VTRLGIQNPELNMSDLSGRKVSEKEQTLACSVDPDSFKALTKSNFKAFWGLRSVTFRTLKDVKEKPEAGSTAGKSPPQYCYEELRCCPHAGTLDLYGRN
jgi:hypothetical protein